MLSFATDKKMLLDKFRIFQFVEIVTRTSHNYPRWSARISHNPMTKKWLVVLQQFFLTFFAACLKFLENDHHYLFMCQQQFQKH